MKAKKEAFGDEEEVSRRRSCYANLTSCKFVFQLGRPTAVSIPPPNPPSQVPSMHCSASNDLSILTYSLFLIFATAIPAEFLTPQDSLDAFMMATVAELRQDKGQKLQTRLEDSASRDRPKVHWKKDVALFECLKCSSSPSLPCFHSMPWIGIAVVSSLLFLQTLRSLDFLSQHRIVRIVSCFHLDCTGDRESLEEV